MKLKRFFSNEKPLTHGWLRRMYLYQIIACIAVYGGLLIRYTIKEKKREQEEEFERVSIIL